MGRDHKVEQEPDKHSEKFEWNDEDVKILDAAATKKMDRRAKLHALLERILNRRKD